MGTKIKRKTKGSWLPVNPNTAKEYMDKLRQNIRAKKGKRSKTATSDSAFVHSVVQEFQDLINNDAVVRMNFTKMIDQVPGYYKEEDAPGFYLESIDEMLEMIDYILGTAPEYNDTDLVGFPINTILNWTMGVPAGAAAFRNEKVNAMFKKILQFWGKGFLSSEDSKYVFEDGGSWRSQEALEQLQMEQYLANPAGEWPYDSWNKFFIREFLNIDVERPIYQPENDNAVIAACDSEVYSIQCNAKLQDWFWVKSQPYSLWDMLANEDGYKKTQSDNEHFDQYVKPFEGGTVFQAFLSAFKYHRWHSPVSGTIEKAYVKDGTYYSATQAEGLDQASPDLSQGYIAHTATRAIIFIRANEPIGLMCVIFIGMAEVSSCIINDNIQPGYQIQKGEELGYFQFGGSTHCLVFREGVIPNKNEGTGKPCEAEFTDNQGKPLEVGKEIQVRQRIALVG